ncbi:MAG: hypothetical protein ACTHMG_13060 [Sphingomonas sp.]
MFLDDRHFHDGPRPFPAPRREVPGEVVARRFFLGLSLVLLILPVTADGIVQLIRYLFD